MENSLVDSGETMEMITTDKTEETVKVILKEVKSQDDMDHGEAPVPETVAPANKGTVSAVEDERFMYKFSEIKNVTVDRYKGKAFLSIGKKNYHQGNAKFRGIHFPIKQWSVLKNNFAAIEEAIKHCQSKNKTKTGHTQVNKYIEFKMVEEKPILEQVQDFNKIADSIFAAGMLLDEKFHVSTIISKFPSSWKGFVTRLMREEFLTVSMLMERVKAVEEQRITYSPAATGSSQMETRLSLGTTNTGLKRKEPERDIIIGYKGNESDERASKKPNQIPEYVGSETQARTNNED